MKKVIAAVISIAAITACVPPILWEVAPIGTSSSNTPQYTFHSEVFGPLTYGGSCSSSTNYVKGRGDITITLDALSDGTYSDCTITIKDAGIFNAQAATLTISSFTIATGAGPLTSWYKDADTDGYGDPATLVTGDKPDNTYVTDNTDCADDDIAINPGASEIADGIDNDCDGSIDEVCYTAGSIFGTSNLFSYRGLAQGVNVAITSGFDASDRLSYTGSNVNVTSTSWNTDRGILTIGGSIAAFTAGDIVNNIQYVSHNEVNANKTVSFVTFNTSGAGPVFMPGLNKYYEYIPAAGISYADAKTACLSRFLWGRRGDLATVSNADEQNALFNFFGSNTVWLGGKGVVTVDGDTWSWDSVLVTDTFYVGNATVGSALGYTNWAANEPAALTEQSYVLMDANGNWNGRANLDTSANGYFCEYATSANIISGYVDLQVSSSSCTAP